MIEQLGFELMNRAPLPLAYAEVGDSEDHVVPTAKDSFTDRFADLLLPTLRNGRQRAQERRGSRPS